jgi:elongator complex protein 3
LQTINSKSKNELACQLILEHLSNLSIEEMDINLINKVKNDVCRQLHLSRIPSNSELIHVLKGNARLRRKLVIKKTRGFSGIIVVSVMSKPYPCPHGRCIYCPTVSGVPQSYTGHEPSSMRGLQNNYDPYLQVTSRLQQLQEIGHDLDKVELIIQGGTFPSTSTRYQKWFVKNCLDAIIGKKLNSLIKSKKSAEESSVRNVGITIETRPDWCGESHIDFMLNLGVTRVELGVQTLNNSIYSLVHRGHTIADVIKAFRTAKDAGLKICAHMMPNLPGSTVQDDLNVFQELFANPHFKPDMLKIYPCLVVKDSELYSWWLSREYKPYSLHMTIDLVAQIKRIVPPWIRIMRVQRDIPAKVIIDGVKKSNLRELVQKRLSETQGKCRCIRCREIGLKYKVIPSSLNIEIRKYEYYASEGVEYFISAEDFEKDILLGYLRLRIPSKKLYRSDVEGAALVRELHVFGRMVPVGQRVSDAFQHKGWGKALLREGEYEALRNGMEKVLVNSGLGVRPYYRKLGYELEEPYMVKYF